MTRFLTALLCALFVFGPQAFSQAVPRLAAAVAPNARAIAANTPATVFATVLNAGQVPATNCRVEAEADNPLGTNVSYQRTDATNQPVGTANTPFDIPASGSQTLVLTITPNGQSPINGSNFELLYVCDETQLPGIPGVSDVLISTQTNADIIMILQTLSGDGVVRFAGNGRRGVAAGAAVNIGSNSDALQFVPSFPGDRYRPAGPSFTHHSGLLICQTNASSICLSPPAAEFTLPTMATNDVITFNVYFDDSAETDIPFLPEFLRIFVNVTEIDTGPFGTNRGVAGATSVAVSEPDGPGGLETAPGYGHWYGYYGNAANYSTQRVKIILSPDGDFIMRPFFSTGFVRDSGAPSEILAGQVTPGRNGAALNPTGSVRHYSGFERQADAQIDGLVLNVQGRADGRIAPLNNARIRGYFERQTPDAVLEFNPPSPGNNGLAFQAPLPDYQFIGNLAIQESLRQFTGSLGVIREAGASECDSVVDIAPRLPAEGQPASQIFDVTMSISDCSGVALPADPSGSYTGWAAVDTWLTDPGLVNGQAVCAIVAVVTRASDGFSFPFYLSTPTFTDTSDRLECPNF